MQDGGVEKHLQHPTVGSAATWTILSGPQTGSLDTQERCLCTLLQSGSDETRWQKC